MSIVCPFERSIASMNHNNMANVIEVQKKQANSSELQIADTLKPGEPPEKSFNYTE